MKGPRLRRSIGALKPHPLAEHPDDLPCPLFVHGGIEQTRFEALAFHSNGLHRHSDLNLERLEDLKQAVAPLLVRVQGLGDPLLIEQALTLREVPPELHAALVETPQCTRVDALGESLQMVTHRLKRVPPAS